MEEKNKTDRNGLYALLTVIFFAALSLAAIFWMKGQEAQVLPNDTAALLKECFIPDGWEPSQKQEDIIEGSVEILTNEAEDAGVKVTLRAAYGNGYVMNYLVDVVLPEGMNAGEGCSFENKILFLNDNSFNPSSSGASSGTVSDENPEDNHYTLRLSTKLKVGDDSSCDYRFDNGIIRTLDLQNIRIENEEGTTQELLQGNWSFDLRFRDPGKMIQMVSAPLNFSGMTHSYWGNKDPIFYEAELSSFLLTEFGAYSTCKTTQITEDEEFMGPFIRPWVILKDGRTIALFHISGGNTDWDFMTQVPIPLDEVAYVVLTDNVLLKMP